MIGKLIEREETKPITDRELNEMLDRIIEENSELFKQIGSDYDENGRGYWEKS